MTSKTWRRTAAGAVLWLSAAAGLVSAAERAETLLAIHWVENPRNSPRPGPGGELGPYQFREATWKMHTSEPFSRARERELSEVVARRHYDWIGRGLTKAGLPVTPYNVALAWNGGLRAAVRGQVPARAHDYAERVHNLAGQLARERLAQGGP